MIINNTGRLKRGLVLAAATALCVGIGGGALWFAGGGKSRGTVSDVKGPLLPAHLSGLVKRMLETPMGADGGPGPERADGKRDLSPSAPPEPASSNAEEGDEAIGYDEIPPGLRAYPAEFAVDPGEQLKVYLALTPTVSAPEALKSVTVRAIGPLGPEGDPMARPVPQLDIRPKACRSFFGTGCAFDQSLTISTEGLKEGAYFAVVATANSEFSFAFLVRSLRAKKRFQVVLPDWTTHAYANTGGANLYGITDPQTSARVQPSPRLLRVSLDRFIPETAPSYHSLSQVARFAAWLEKERGSTGYMGDADLHGTADLRSIADVVVLIGHAEYWTQQSISHLHRFQEAGGHILNLSGNTGWWQVRFENNELLVSKDSTARHNEIALGTDTGLFLRRSKLQIDDLLGASFRYGGFSVARVAPNVKELTPQTSDGGITVMCEHPVLAAAGLAKGAMFGEQSELVSGEIDGLPLAADGTLVFGKGMRAGARIRVLGKGVIVPLYYSYYKEARFRRNEISVMVEYQRAPSTGRVMSLSSMGALNVVLANDETGKKVILGLADYLSGGKFDDVDVAGCAWQVRAEGGRSSVVGVDGNG